MEIDLTTFAAEVRSAGDDLSPARAGLLLARECAYPDLRPSDYLVQIDDLAAAAHQALAGLATAHARGLALAEFLFQTAGFQGNTRDYADPRNSYLNQVLERRLGIPITLSVLYVEVGQRLGLPVAGVGLPGHFIVRLMAEDGPTYLDPFNGGRQLKLADCRALVKSATGVHGAFDMDWLAPAPGRAVAARMLNNLRAFYVSVEDWPRAVAIVERLRVLEPGLTSHLRDLGLLCYRAGAYRKASVLLNEYLVREPSAPDAEAVRQSRDLLLSEMARLN